MPESPLFEAHRIVHADRGADYGPPAEDFSRTGRLWAVILEPILKPGATITPQQVAMCMIALKLSREVFHHKRDTLVDIAGYTETLSMIEGESEEGSLQYPHPPVWVPWGSLTSCNPECRDAHL